MTKYQKAIKVRKICEIQSTCEKCIYRNYCKKWFDIWFTPLDVPIEDLSQLIDEEKWKIK